MHRRAETNVQGVTRMPHFMLLSAQFHDVISLFQFSAMELVLVLCMVCCCFICVIPAWSDLHAALWEQTAVMTPPSL